jgi:hypothetical protein
LALKAAQPTPEEIADLCLTHLVQNPEQLADFMGVTGFSPVGLQHSVRDGSVARGLIDYVVQNEPLLLAICQSSAVSPEAVMRVWAKLNPAG